MQRKVSHELAPMNEVPRFSMTKLEGAELTTFWPKIEALMSYVPHTWRHWTQEYIYTSAMNETIQVWAIGPPPNAVMIFFTQIAVYPTMKVLCMVWGAGSFTEDMLPLIEATMVNYAKITGCVEIELRGRMGWEPALKKVGFTRESVIWSRKVPDMRMN